MSKMSEISCHYSACVCLINDRMTRAVHLFNGFSKAYGTIFWTMESNNLSDIYSYQGFIMRKVHSTLKSLSCPKYLGFTVKHVCPKIMINFCNSRYTKEAILQLVCGMNYKAVLSSVC